MRSLTACSGVAKAGEAREKAASTVRKHLVFVMDLKVLGVEIQGLECIAAAILGSAAHIT
jgi:hypothetical protein